jgi:flagellar assembly protein FliH
MGGVWKREDLQARAAIVRPLYGPCAEVEERSEVVAPQPAPLAPQESSAGEAARARQLRLLNNLATSLVAERGRLLSDLRPEIVQLALAIAHEVIGYEAAVDRRVVEHALQGALERLNSAARVVAHVHPADLAELKSLPPETLGCVDDQVLELVADENIERGGCRLESDRGAVEATLDMQLRLLGEALDWDPGTVDAAGEGEGGA